MKKDYIIAVPFIILSLFVAFITWFVSQPVPKFEPVMPVVEEIPVEAPDLALDLNTLCLNSDQFGINHSSCLYFNDGSYYTVKESSIQVDNILGRGHVISLYPNHNLDVWFDTNNSACYTSLSSSDNIAVDWTVVTANTKDDAFGKHLQHNIDYIQTIDYVDELVKLFSDYEHEVVVTEQGIWYIAAIPTSMIRYSAAISPAEATMRVFVPYDNSLITQVDVTCLYDDNELNVKSEVIEYDFEVDVNYCCEVPDIVKDASDNYTMLSTAYVNLMQ